VDSDIISANIFARAEGLPLIDKYAAYQILANNWPGIMGDVEIIQTEGFGACNVVEEKTKVVKDKNGVEQEVVDGLKGRIIPFDLVQNTLFQDDLNAINNILNRIEMIDSELDAVHDELLGMDDTDKYFDAEKDNAFVPKEITADSKPKADVEEDIKDLLRTIVLLWNEKKEKNALVKQNKLDLEKKTIETIESLDMEGINYFLEMKWIKPITSAIEDLPNVIIQKLVDTISTLNDKYAVTYNDIESGIVEAEQNLATLISQLTGNEYAVKGLYNLIKK
jgi:type I restriction enzyme M protein